MIIFKTFILLCLIFIWYRLEEETKELHIRKLELFLIVLLAEVAIAFLSSFRMEWLFLLILLFGLFLFVSKQKLSGTILFKPAPILIDHGKIQFQELTKLSCSLDTLLTSLKKEGIQTVEEVEKAIYEKGKIKIVHHIEHRPTPLIINGEVREVELREIGKNRKWLLELLKERNLTLPDVYYAFYSDSRTFIIKKGDLS